MKNKTLILLTSCLLVFSSCTPNKGGNLAMGAISANDQGMYWEAVQGATKYSVVVNNENPVEVTAPSYSFNSTAGNYNVTVTAIGEGNQSGSPASFSYETKLTSLSSISETNKVITWGQYVGKGIEIRKQSEENFTRIEGNSYTVTESNLYIVRAAPGYANHVYYALNPSSSAAQKGVVVSFGATDTYVLEDGSFTDDVLAEKYTIKKYDGGWKDTTATILQNYSNYGFSEGKCVQLQYWHYGIWFKYTKAISVDKSYDTFSFKVKGHVATYASLTFEITDHIYIGDKDLCGVYISYQTDQIPNEWTYYTVSLNDPNWRIDYNGGKYTFAQLSALIGSYGYTVKSLADMMPFFKQFSFRANATADDDGTKAYLYFDDVALSNVGASSSAEVPVLVNKNYAIESDAFAGKATFANDNTGVLDLTMKSNGSTAQLPVRYSTSSGKLNMVCEAQNYDFVASFNSVHNGDSFTLGSVTGSAAGALSNFKAEKYVVLDDFESYTETGKGHDKSNNHTPPEVSGLRAAYLADWYTTSNDYPVSLIDDPNWKLMGSTDYLQLDETNGRDGSKAMKIKYSTGGAMRYTTAGLLLGGAIPFSGKTFSFFAKGTAGNSIRVKVRIFAVDTMTKSNHTLDTVSVVKEITIEKDSGWTEYTIDLKEGTTYYGVSFTTQVDNDTTAQYPLIDDINVYGSLSPWGN